LPLPLTGGGDNVNLSLERKMKAAAGWRRWVLLSPVLFSSLFYPWYLGARPPLSGLFSSPFSYDSCLLSIFPFDTFSLSQTQASDPGYYSDPAKELELLIKVLKFERNSSSSSRQGESLAIGIINQKSDSISSWLAADWLALNDWLKQQPMRIYNRPIRIVDIDLDSFAPDLLEEKVRQEAVDFVYLGTLNPKKNPELLKNICRLCSKLKLGTFTANPEQLDSGVALVFSLKGEKPQIIINLEAARAQGLNFSSQLLNLVNVRKADGNTNQD